MFSNGRYMTKCQLLHDNDNTKAIAISPKTPKLKSNSFFLNIFTFKYKKPVLIIHIKLPLLSSWHVYTNKNFLTMLLLVKRRLQIQCYVFIIFAIFAQKHTCSSLYPLTLTSIRRHSLQHELKI